MDDFYDPKELKCVESDNSELEIKSERDMIRKYKTKMRSAKLNEDCNRLRISTRKRPREHAFKYEANDEAFNSEDDANWVPKKRKKCNKTSCTRRSTHATPKRDSQEAESSVEHLCAEVSISFYVKLSNVGSIFAAYFG